MAVRRRDRNGDPGRRDPCADPRSPSTLTLRSRGERAVKPVQPTSVLKMNSSCSVPAQGVTLPGHTTGRCPMTEAMGHGVNQRKAIQMTPDEVEAFLAERRPMTMCSLSPDGSIHAVAMWYGFLDGCVTVETKAKSQKVQNLRRDPRLHAALRGRRLLRGAARRRAGRPGGDHRRPRQALDARRQRVRALLRRRTPTSSSRSSRPCCTSGWRSSCTLERTVSWDHRKLGLPSTRPAPGVKIAIRQAVAVPPAQAIAAYGSPAFYEGRPIRDDIAVLEVVRHDDDG